MTDQPPDLPLVSVVIPTYEQDAFAREAVRSVLAQDYPRLEVIVADDASPHARYDAVRAIDDPRLRYHRHARNIGRTQNYRVSLRDLARGDWAMMLDGDDYLTDPGFITRAVAVARQDPGIVMVAARSELRDGAVRVVSDHPGDVVMTGPDVLRALPDARYFLQHLAVIYRRRDAVALDFYRSPAISSDWESLYRLAATGKVAFVDAVVGVWRIHGTNASGSREREAMIDNLDIWDPVYAHAVACGMDEAQASRRRDAMLRFAMRQHIPRVARTPRALITYLRRLRRRHPRALAGLAHAPTLARLVLALLGHYGKH